MNPPEFQFVLADDGARIAYQTLGSGPPAIIVPEILGSLAFQWEFDLYQRVWEHMSSHLSLILYDKRGTGMSDGFSDEAHFEMLAGDIKVVIEAAGHDHVSLVAAGDGAMEAVAFAALYPELTDRLALSNPSSGVGRVDSASLDEGDQRVDIGRTRDQFASEVLPNWGVDATAMTESLVPSQAGDPSILAWWTKLQRVVVTRDEAVVQVKRMFGMQLGDLPERVKAPTLITHTVDNDIIPISSGRLIADQIPNATMIEVPGADHVVWFTKYWRDIVDAQIGFITGADVEVPIHRKFAVVLFTDVVDSTQSALAEGDDGWKERLDTHDRAVDQIISEHSGTVVKSTGDGILATFDSLSSSLDAAVALVDRLSDLGIPIRAGLHSGEIELREDDVSGTIVNLAARVMDTAGEGEIFTTAAIRDGLLGSSFEFSDAGQHTLKGFEDSWQLYRLSRT